MTSTGRRSAVGVLQLGALALMVACDGLLVDPTAPPASTLTLSFGLSPAAAAAARGPAEAFDEADQVDVRILPGTGDEPVHEERVPFTSTGGDSPLPPIQVTLEAGAYRLEIEMLWRGQSVFRGGAPLTLEPGRTTAVTISVDPVASAVEVDAVPAIDALGETRQLSARVLLATGDDIPSATVVWSSLDPAVATVTADGLLTSVGEGTTQVLASYEGLTGQAQVTVQATVTAVVVEPPAPVAVLGSIVQFTATPLDRNENALVRTVTWSSTVPTVATVDPEGRATTVGVGTTRIVAEAGGATGEATLTVRADPPLVETSDATGITTTTATLEASVTPNGLPTVAWFEWGPQNAPSSFVSTPERPVGAGFSAQPFAETLSGLTPGTTYFFRVAARNEIGTSFGQVRSFTTEALLEIVTTELPSGVVDVAYGATVQAVGGDGTYTWALVGGSLPPGLVLGTDGRITGTPQETGTYVFTVQVASGSQVVSRSLSISILQSLQILTTSLPDGTERVQYDHTLQATGGTGTYVWDLASGTFPDGLSLASNGRISGVPGESGKFDVSVRVTSGPQVATRALSLVVNPATGQLTGTVTYAGSPLPGIQVTLTGVVTGATVTNAQGRYTFSSLPAGTYTATISPGIPASQFGPVQKSTFVPDGTLVVLNFGGDGPPDITIASSVGLSTPPPYFTGQQVTLAPWTVVNQGNGPTGTFSNRVYLSTNSIISTADIPVAGNSNFSLAPGQGVTWTGITFPIPNVSAGTYYVGIIVDWNNGVAESSEGNNSRASGQLTIFVPPSAPPP